VEALLEAVIGRSMLGNRSTPRVRNEKAPTTVIASTAIVGKTGRRTQNSASFCMV
jgi:hypothetical protein